VQYEGSAVVVVWNEDGELNVADAVELTPVELQQLHDVVPMNLDTDAEPELLLLADSGGWWGDLDPEAGTYVFDVYHYLGGGRRARLEVADFNLDGLDDLAVLEDTDLYVMLAKAHGPLGADVVDSEPGDETGGGQ
jgi:hypothetical protein